MTPTEQVRPISWQSITIKIADLNEYDKNPRKITKKDFDKLVRSIKEDGYRTRIVIDLDNRILGGHSRKRALLAAGYKETDEIEVLRATRQLTEKEFQRINIRDNITFGEFDFDILANEFDFNDLTDWGLENLPVIDVIDAETTEDDDFVETDVETRCKLGDVWMLGNHRLMCGDSTNSDHVLELAQNIKPDLIYADPPYGISVNTSSKSSGNGLAKRGKYKDIIGDNNTDVARDVFNLTTILYDDIPLVYWGANYYDFLQPSKCWLVWYKKDELPSDAFCDSELAYTNCYKHSKTFAIQWKGMIKEGEMGEKRVHPTQKPIKLALDIFDYLNAGKNIYDPFGGSGTTLIACEKSNRNCLMMELSPNYCDIIINRWEKLTGQKAELYNG